MAARLKWTQPIRRIRVQLTMEPNNRQHAVELAEKADLMMVDGDSEEARQVLEEAVALDPRNAEARRMLAGLKVRLAKARGEAVVEVSQAEAFHEVDGLIETAKDANMQGQYELAASLLRRALSIDPDNRDAKSLLTHTHTLQSQAGDMAVSFPGISRLF
jgi:Flp pilus assembly protein TadD